MKTRSSSLTKLLSLLLTVITICSICTSCAAGDITEFGPNFASDSGFASDLAPNNTNGSIQLFANGAYMAKVIHDGTPLGKSICEKLTKLISDYTGIPLSSEDSYAQTAAPAILVGETTYPESKKAYETIGNDRATATVSGNKYVIAFSSEEAGENLLNTFKNLLNTKATKLQITIDKKWNISTAPAADQGTNNNSSTNNGSSNGNSSESETTTPLETFDESTLNASGTLPTLGTSYNAGQSSKTYIMKDATKDKYTTLCSDIEKGGFKKYTSNSIGNNLFTTYLTKAQIVHVMFFPNKKQIRTAVDKRGTGTSGFALAGLSGDNKYQKTTESKMILCDISNADWPGGMCLIFKLADGRFFIVDAGIGGYISDGRSSKGSSSGWIYATLAKHAADPKNIQVAAWLITHVHSDHAGGLYDMALGYYGYEGKKHTVMPKEVKKYIKIDKIIYNAPDSFPDCDREGWMSKIISAFSVKNVVKAHPGQIFHISDLKLTIYGSLDVMLENSSKSSDLNDFSIVSRAEFNGKSMLIMGDSDTIPNPVIAEIYKESLKSDILQMSHHGYGDTGDHEVNSYCNPEMTIWPVAKKDQRTDYNVNVKISMASSLTTLGNLRNHNTSKGTATATLSNGKNYRPGMGNLIFDKNWSTTTTSRSEIMSAIPKCDGTHCGNKSCSKKSSSNLYVE